MVVVIDRFEGLLAVCEKEDRTMINIKRILLPRDAKEGDVLNIDGAEITIDVIGTAKRKEIIEELTKDLWS